ncbi:MAG: Sensor histidine kinase [Clostridiales bacterium]|jgi:signal transduction histidine kinase|nr:Sensor histidine kinase [Clostridiales bacterium]
MTIRKQWLLVLILIAVFSVSINAFVLSTLTDKYFTDYVKQNYEMHFKEIVDYSTKALATEEFSATQMAIELETHLVDPINRIKVYNENGILIVDVTAGYAMGMGMMNKGMMRRMQDTQVEEVDHAKIMDGNKVIGQINIVKYSSAENSLATWMFKSSLIKNSMYSIGIVLIFAIIIGILVSKKMSKDLINTADMAQNIDMGNTTTILQSKVKEIRVIQQSLESLRTSLKLKQKSRKTLTDELVHQTRTPLTILKTHLEGIEDGVIDMTPEEIRICEDQIENITSIISNMSGMIDAEKDIDTLKIEEFELSQLMRQIVNGLKVQFEKKDIDLKIMEHKKIILRTDKYKLSQAIYNILTNAYKFTEENGKVSINYFANTDGLTITIEDDGVGITKEDQLKIFDAYYKGNKGVNSSGEGIGLYVVKENLKHINGSVMVESERNKGSKFIVNIPLKL